MKIFNRIMLVIVLIALTGGIGLFVLTAINPELVHGWFGQAQEKPLPDVPPDIPEKPEGEEIKDFKFSGNKITGYLGTEVVLDNIPKSYSKFVEEKGEKFTVTLEDLSDQDKAMEIQQKLLSNSFYCKAKGMSEKIYCEDMQDWETKLSELYKDMTEALPMEIELLKTTYYVGNDFEVNEIGEGSFANNTIITDVIVPEHITKIGSNSFTSCNNLRNVVLNANITKIEYRTFTGCSNLININLENVQEIDVEAFHGCSNLSQVSLNDDLERISRECFRESGLASIKLPKNLKYIDDQAFMGCKLTELIIPEGVTMLGREIVKNAAVEKLEIPSTVINLMSDVFYFSSSLQLVKIDCYIEPNELIAIMRESKAQFFISEENLRHFFSGDFYYQEINNADIYSLDEYTGERLVRKEITDYRFGFPNGDTGEIQKYLGNSSEVVLPDYVRYNYETIILKTIETKEEFDVFYQENQNLKCYSIGYMSHKGTGGDDNNIETLRNRIEGDYQQANDLFPIEVTAKNLYVYETEIGVPVNSISGNEVFNENVKSVVLGNTYKSISENAFLNSSIRRLTLGENFKTFYFNTFIGTSENLIIINNSNNVINVLWGNHINNSDLLGKMYVKDELFSAYISSESWDEFPRIYPMSELNAEAGEIVYTFNNGTRSATLVKVKTVNSIEIPKTIERAGVTYSVEGIGEYAFDKNKNISSIIIPSSIKNIGSFAFMDCSNLTNVSFEDNSQLTTIEDFAFSRTGINEITIPDGVVSIKGAAFSMCENLTTINFPSSLQTLGKNTYTGGVFDKSYNISSITVAEGNTNFKIENSCLIDTTTNSLIKAFVDVSEITIPSDIQIIMDSAFAGCEMTTLSIPEGVFGIGARAFDNCQNLKEISFPSSVLNLESGLINRCPNLKTIKYLATNIPPCFVEETIENIYVDDTMVEQFKQADIWSNLANKIHPISELN